MGRKRTDSIYETTESSEDGSDFDVENDAEQLFIDNERAIYAIYRDVKDQLSDIHPSFGDKMIFATFTQFIQNTSSVLQSQEDDD